MGVVVAAGRGSRMGVYTEARPKCLIRIGGRTLLEITIERLRTAGCREIVVVTGYQRELIERFVAGMPDVRCVCNPRAHETNLLHSLMSIGGLLLGRLFVTYADTIVTDSIYSAVAASATRGGVQSASARPSGSEAPVTISVDTAWRDYYVGRERHPTAEAEKVYMSNERVVCRLGKHLSVTSAWAVGEFTGVLRASAEGTAQLRELFADVDARTALDAPFQAAGRWRHACLTDLLQEYVDRGGRVLAAPVERGWAELDTPEDLERLPRLAERQGVAGLLGDVAVS